MIKVNGQEITDEAIQFELNRLVKFYAAHMSADQIRAQMDSLRKKAKQQAIGAKLLLDEADKLDIQAPVEKVDAKMDAIAESVGGRDKFEARLGEQGLKIEQVREGVERGVKVDVLIERISEEVAEPTEADIEEHYRKHVGEYTKPEQAQVRHILIKPASESHEDRETAKSRLLGIRDSIQRGADFAEQAAAFSECPSGRRTGGSLGWLSRGTTVPEVDKAIFSMNIGELSGIVESPLGFHLLHKIDQEESGPAPFEDVKEKVRDFLRHARRGEAITQHVEELKKTAVIEEK